MAPSAPWTPQSKHRPSRSKRLQRPHRGAEGASAKCGFRSTGGAAGCSDMSGKVTGGMARHGRWHRRGKRSAARALKPTQRQRDRRVRSGCEQR
eukprot:3532179-Alexandrium_andersonii.AAC.1